MKCVDRLFYFHKRQAFPALVSFESTQNGQEKLQAEVRSKLMEVGLKIGSARSEASSRTFFANGYSLQSRR